MPPSQPHHPSLPCTCPLSPPGGYYYTHRDSSVPSFALAFPLAWNAFPTPLHTFRDYASTPPPTTALLFNEAAPELGL